MVYWIHRYYYKLFRHQSLNHTVGEQSRYWNTLELFATMCGDGENNITTQPRRNILVYVRRHLSRLLAEAVIKGGPLTPEHYNKSTPRHMFWAGCWQLLPRGNLHDYILPAFHTRYLLSVAFKEARQTTATWSDVGLVSRKRRTCIKYELRFLY
jgi:hypothetical protein